MKQILCIVVVLLMLVSMIAGCAQPAADPVSAGQPAAADTQPEDKPKATEETVEPMRVAIMIENVFGTQSFVDVALKGCERAVDELGIELTKIESVDASNGANSLRSLAEEGMQFIIMPTNSFTDVIKEVAPEYPDVMFACLDAEVPDLPNVYSASYKEQECGFLVGALAGLITNTNKIGWAGGMPGYVQSKYEFGYKTGARYTNPGVEVSAVYVGSYADVNKGKEVGTALYTAGNDFVCAAAGGSSMGVFTAAEEFGEGAYCFGGADGQFHVSPEKIIASEVKTVDEVAYQIILDAVNGDFASRTGTPEVLGLKEGGVGLLYTDRNDVLLAQYVTPEIKDQVEELREKIIAGEIVVPTTQEEYDAFTFPA